LWRTKPQSLWAAAQRANTFSVEPACASKFSRESNVSHYNKLAICAGMKMPSNGLARTGSNSDQLESAGKSILSLLEKAAGVAEENTRHALVMAEKLAHEVRAAEDHIAELEEELLAHRDRADRAEQWLDKINKEIDQQFVQRQRKTVR
jgi:hypothetical protein